MADSLDLASTKFHACMALTQKNDPSIQSYLPRFETNGINVKRNGGLIITTHWGLYFSIVSVQLRI